MSTIMAHMVVGYPDLERSRVVARGLARGGAAYLELQFPFSDPTADGPTIQEACQNALEAGFTVDAGLAFVANVFEETGLPIYIMTYASIAYRRGIDAFLRAGTNAGATGFIIPDLPPDYDEGAYALAADVGAEMMPVLVPTATQERLNFLARKSPPSIYAALRAGITGSRTELGETNLRFLDSLCSVTKRVFAGFGIQSREQVVALEPHVHAPVVGSELVRVVAAQRDASPAQLERAVALRTSQLAGVDAQT
jgi:tryptophan synthase alpha chain